MTTVYRRRAPARRPYQRRRKAQPVIVKEEVVETVTPVRRRQRRPRKQTSILQTLVPKGTFSAAGGALGSMFGPGASYVGGKIGEVISRVTGFGDYVIQENSLMRGGLSPPEVVNSINRGGVIVRHREYIGDINATIAFTVSNFNINPGVQGTFPWLSQVAVAYEEYEFRGLIFEFKSLSSDAVLSSATSSALGFVAMATQYNAASPTFPDKKSLENYEYANSDKPSCSFMHPVECKRSLNVDTHLYIRNGAVPIGQDQKTYDLGDFQIATGGMQAASGVCGELWATYEVELFHPKFTVAGALEADHYQAVAWTNANPLGTVQPARTSASNLGTTINIIGNTINFPATITSGQFLITVSWNGGASAGNVYPALTFTNCVGLFRYLNNTAGTFNSPATGTANGLASMNFQIQVTSANAVIKFGAAGVLPTSIGTLDIYIFEIAIID